MGIINVDSKVEEIVSSIKDLEWGDVRSALDEYFPDGNIPDDLREQLDKLAEGEVVFDFSDGDGWGYEEKI